MDPTERKYRHFILDALPNPDQALKAPLYDDDTFLFNVGLNCTKIWAAAECRLIKECSEPVYAHQNITYVKDLDIYATMGKSASSVGRYSEVADEMGQLTCGFSWMCSEDMVPYHRAQDSFCGDIADDITCPATPRNSFDAISFRFLLETHEERSGGLISRLNGIRKYEIALLASY
ncbi:hypothetical protein K438DRAFT_1754127 [Mycena galopus ATCC 62051]|nr:hypothetical protein K438DRAFT_1754127 [Mycena galopus ATCC 62051]